MQNDNLTPAVQPWMKMKHRDAVLSEAEKYARRELSSDPGGHDWWHARRVADSARLMAEESGADRFICEMASLLHDIVDSKRVESEEEELARLSAWLSENGVPGREVSHIMRIISTMSFRGGSNPPMDTLEGKVVQDADRLDAMGAIGIARAFAYSGHIGQLIHNPESNPRQFFTKEEYVNERTTAINHFYEKLLKLPDLMNTDLGRMRAEKRKTFMLAYLEQFYREWAGYQ